MSEDAIPQQGNFKRVVPQGDERERLVCVDCGFINYENPKIVVGSVVHHGDKILLCRRAIYPRKGFWTFAQSSTRTCTTSRASPPPSSAGSRSYLRRAPRIRWRRPLRRDERCALLGERMCRPGRDACISCRSKETIRGRLR